MFANTMEEFISSVNAFNANPLLTKKIVGSTPLYFLYIKRKGQYMFGMSKFCVFKDITPASYIKKYRYTINGEPAQKLIAKKLQTAWISYHTMDATVQKSFNSWVVGLLPNYNCSKANFIALEKNGPEHRGSLILSPKQLIEQLQRQSRIGKAGEEIAYHYEVARLKKLNIEDPAACIERVSLTNTAQGYDMASITPHEKRYIEVKSTMRNKDQFFLSENEVITLETLGKAAYLYLVQVTDLKKKKGHVFAAIQDPIKKLRKQRKLEPVAYRVREFTC